MKKMTFLLLLGAFLFAQTAVQPAGSGTVGDPYQIATLSNLYWMTQSYDRWDDHYIQTANIDASATSTWDDGDGGDPEGWPKLYDEIEVGPFPWDTEDYFFSGSYNGQGHIISNIFYNRSGEFNAFFAFTENATISNLALVDVNITGSTEVGSLIGYASGTTLTNCYSSGVVNGYSEIGGLVGYVYGNTTIISQCYTSCSVNATGNNSGGFTGYTMGNPTINNCYSRGNVVSTADASGGFVGWNRDASATINNCYSTGTVTVPTNKGGFAGKNDGFINNCFWDTQSSGVATSDGGTGVDTDAMKTQSTFTNVGWDFITTWNLDAGKNDGYPNLPAAESASPITLRSFSAALQNGAVHLNWSTESETNNCAFLVYRNGEILARLDAAGNSSETLEYTYVDDQVIPGHSYTYVLADVDFANTITKHHALNREVLVDASRIAMDFAISKAYPNPFNPSISLELSMPLSADACLDIYDMSGKKIAELHNDQLTQGRHQITWDAGDLRSGVYIARFTSGAYRSSQKIVLMK